MYKTRLRRWNVYKYKKRTCNESPPDVASATTTVTHTPRVSAPRWHRSQRNIFPSQEPPQIDPVPELTFEDSESDKHSEDGSAPSSVTYLLPSAVMTPPDTESSVAMWQDWEKDVPRSCSWQGTELLLNNLYNYIHHMLRHEKTRRSLAQYRLYNNGRIARSSEEMQDELARQMFRKMGTAVHWSPSSPGRLIHWPLLNDALSHAQQVIEVDSPDLLRFILLILDYDAPPNVKQSLLKMMACISWQVHREGHPLTSILLNMALFGEFSHVHGLILKAVIDRMQHLAGDETAVSFRYREAYAYWLRGTDPFQAVQEARNILKITQSMDEDPYQTRRNEVRHVAVILKDVGNYDEAANIFRVLHEINPEYVLAAHLACIASYQQDFRQEEDYLKQALQLACQQSPGEQGTYLTSYYFGLLAERLQAWGRRAELAALSAHYPQFCDNMRSESLILRPEPTCSN